MSDLTYISFGAGTQSTALLVMSALGDHNVPKADVAFFADTGDEPAWVYETLAFYRDWAAQHGIPVETVSHQHGSLSARMLKRIAGQSKSASTIPMFTTGKDGTGAPLGRNCTRDHKMLPIQRAARARLPKGKHATAMLGITIDEAQRMKDSIVPWCTNTYPLVDAGLTREECLVYLHGKGLPLPQKSACVFCPYHSDAAWIELRDLHPAEFERAAIFDDQIRDMSNAGVHNPVYLHRSLKPLREVNFKPPIDDGQLPLWSGFSAECEGMCGV